MNETEIWKRIYQALDDGDYEVMVALLRPLAEKGDAEAQFRLGYRYDNGEGVAQDYAQAIYWYEQSAMQNYAGAECNLGWLYENGNGVSQDFYKAFAWYERSARHGSVWGQVNLADLYEHGNGVAQDYAAAFAWYEKAALQDNGWAQLKLGVFYETGLGVAADESRARQWLEKAAMQGNAEAARRLARFYEDGGAIFADGLRLAGSTPRYLGIPPQMLPRVAAVFPALQAEKNAPLWQQAFAAHQAGDRLTAFVLIRELAEDGDADAHYLLALMYLDGTPIVSDHYPARAALYEVKNEREFVARGHLAQIRYWTEKTHDPLRLMESGSYTREILKKLAAEGDAPAQNFLGCIYAANKRNIFADDPKATECFAEAAAQNDAMGQFNLALAYESGEDDHCDWAQAHNYYEKAAAQDFAPAQFRLALQYLHGKGVARDEALAWRWMARAAAAGDADAQNALGLQALRDGNTAQAQQWFAQAAAQGLAAAQNNLAVCDPAAAQCEGLTQAAAQGEPRAWFNLGVLAERAGNVAQARQHYARAALCGDLPAQQAYRQLAAGATANTPSAAMQQALADWAAGDCRRARAAVQTAAEAGDVWAQFCLACIYDDNRIFLRDEAQAQAWFARAAAGGNIRAQYRLGIRYCDEARRLYQYHVKAKACDSARLWLVQAAIQGDGAAQRALGAMFANRDYGVPDRVLANYWNDAARRANAPVADPPGAVQRDSTVAAVDSRQITAYRSAARQGDAAAQYALGVLYQTGEVVPQGFAQAFQWYERAAQQHYTPAQLALGILFEYGKGVAANAVRAVQYYEQAALQGHPVAQYRLALHYRDGEGVAQDTAKAREWLTRAAEQGNPDAAKALAALSA
ncbi:MAG: tetratricopeptide repeat protein [Cardiobacterium sp.]